jgi:hypothetical protein
VSGRRSANGDPLRPSRLLFATDGEEAARRIRRFYEEDRHPETDSTPVSPGASGLTPERPDVSGFALPPEPVIARMGVPERLRATDFRTILQDPYGYFLARRRACEPIDDHAREMDGALFGALAHTVLERFGRDRASVLSTDRAAVSARLGALLDARVEELFGRNARYARVAVRIQVEQLRIRLQQFAAWHAERIADGWEVRGVEVSTPPGGIDLDVDGIKTGITARIDRVEYHARRKEWALLDYKTSDRAESPRKSHGPRGNAWTDLQLPLYHWLFPRLVENSEVRHSPEETEAPIVLGYVPLSKHSGAVQEAMADWSEDELQHAMETARNVVRSLRDETVRFDGMHLPRYADSRVLALLGIGQLGAVPEEDE